MLPEGHAHPLPTWLEVSVTFQFILLSSRFAQVMIDNLRHHNCDLLGKDACMSLNTQKKRFVNCGFSGAGAINVWDAYEDLPYETRSRIEKIEFLDEFEIMKQLLDKLASRQAIWSA